MKAYISHQMARSYGPLAYRKAKQGFHMLVTKHGQTCFLGHVTPHGFYLLPFDPQKGQGQQLKQMGVPGIVLV